MKPTCPACGSDVCIRVPWFHKSTKYRCLKCGGTWIAKVKMLTTSPLSNGDDKEDGVQRRF